MKYELIKGNNSNYEIKLSLDKSDMENARQRVLSDFKKDFSAPGFRKGHAPLAMVESQIKPEYLQVGIFEEAIHQGLNLVMKENEKIKFIGQVYDLNQKEEKEILNLTFKLDIYPEVEVLNDNWKAFELEEIDDNPTQDEIDEAILNLKKQYAEYKEAEKISDSSVFKVRFEFKDAKGEVMDKGSIILGKEEMTEFPELMTIFVGRENKKKFEVPYDKKLPELLAYKKDKKTPKNIEFEVIDIRDVILPEFTEELLNKLFGNDGIKTMEDLVVKISQIMKEQKRQMMLVKVIEDFIKASESSIKLAVPQTIVNEEFKTRYKSFEERLGGAEKLKEYFEKMGEENKKKTLEDIRKASSESLEKFFKFRKLAELLEVEALIDWNKAMDAEEKIYTKLCEIKGTASKPKAKKAKK